MKLFDSVAFRKPQKNKFDLSHEVKLTCEMGDLIPVLHQEILPGDSFRMSTNLFIRLLPLFAPMMHRVDVTLQSFFVPDRLIWDEWEDFITGGRLGTSAPVKPYFSFNTTNKELFRKSTLLDYMGFPVFDETNGANEPNPNVTNPINLDILPLRAYQLIYNEYYRDQNLTAEVTIPKTSGDSNASIATMATMRKRAWEKDYGTSALPFAQRGTAVGVPFGEVDVTYKQQSDVIASETGLPVAAGTLTASSAGKLERGVEARIENIDELELSGTINDLRRAIRLQEWLEKNATGGARYIEQIRSHFGTISSDARLQRPEFLGGGTSPIQISEILSTVNQFSAEEPYFMDGEPLGTLGGRAVGTGSQNGFKRTFEEHGRVITLLSIKPKTAYQNQVERQFTRFDKFDYAFPEFAQIGEQAVLNKEIWFSPLDSPSPDGTFGYQSRYAEYKQRSSRICGDFRDQLAFWHMGRQFISQPVLNENFVQSDPTKRVYAITNSYPSVNNPCLIQLYHKIDAIRPLPYFGTPVL